MAYSFAGENDYVLKKTDYKNSTVTKTVDSNLVALVDGVTITKSDIYDNGSKTKATLEKYLAAKIQSVVVRATCKSYGVSVSASEISELWVKNSNEVSKQAGDDAVIEFYLLQNKMNAIVDGIISRKDDKFRKCLKDDIKIDVKDQCRNDRTTDVIAAKEYVLRKRALWWEVQYKSANIKIYRFDLRGAISLLGKV
jgi:predicted transcriptional regulator